MMKGRIQRVVRHHVEARSDVRLPTAWIRGSSRPGWNGGRWLTRGSAQASRTGDAPVLGLLGEGGAEARAELLAHAASGARVYALVGPEWGAAPPDVDLLRAPRVLVRRVPEVPAAGVQVGQQARLWIGGGFVLRLDEDQAAALRQTFVRLFWHEAEEEAWSGTPTPQWRRAGERPFDVPLVPRAASVRLKPPDAQLMGNTLGALMHLASGAPPEAAPRRLWIPAGPDHHDRLAQLAKRGEVVWDERGLPDMLITEGGDELLLAGKHGRLRLRLSVDQAVEVARLLEADAAWRFQTDVRLGDLDLGSADVWLPGEVAPRRPEAEQIIEVPQVVASSLRAVPETQPSSRPPPQPLALAARYEWTVLPPRVPRGADDDALVGQWRKLDEEWSARLARVRAALVTTDGDRGRIGRAFARLVGAVLGFERASVGLIARVAELERARPSSSGPAEASRLLAELGELEDAARKLQADLEEAERKAREDEERERQEASWQQRVDAAKHALLDKRRELEAAEQRRSATADDLRTAEDALNGANDETRKDLSARCRKLSDELNRDTRDAQRIRGQIQTLEQQAEERFEFRPPTSPMTTTRPPQAGGRFVPPSPAREASIVPDEALPEVGMLRHYKGQRYLVIDSWQELDAGEQAARRLSARLVAPEDT